MNQEWTIGSLRIPHRLIMAPMCGITHKAFRRMVKDFGAGLVLTQMVSAKALTMNDAKSKKLLEFDESERPVGFQIFGNDADTLAEAARICEGMGADLVDLNMGCPAKKIVNDGGGSALLKDIGMAARIFEKIRAALKIPFTVKMRAGWNKCRDESFEIARIAEASGVNAVALHGRTKAQGYSGKSDWSLIAELKKAVKIPVIGNGDVKSVEDVENMLATTGCDAVMVGREGVSRPWIFKEYIGHSSFSPGLDEVKNLILRQYELFFDYFGVKNGIKNMRKHLCAYTKGIHHGSVFRNRIITMEEWEPLYATINEFFADHGNHA